MLFCHLDKYLRCDGVCPDIPVSLTSHDWSLSIINYYFLLLFCGRNLILYTQILSSIVFLIVIMRSCHCIGVDGTENCKGKGLFWCPLLGRCSQEVPWRSFFMQYFCCQGKTANTFYFGLNLGFSRSNNFKFWKLVISQAC